MNLNMLKEGTITSKIKWVVVGLALLVETVLTIRTVIIVLPDAVMQVIASMGVAMLALSLLILPRQLFNGDIKQGQHRVIAISVLAVELVVMTCNLIVALNEPIGFIALYAHFVLPATPAIVVAGQMLIWLSDPLDRARIEEENAQQTSHILDAQFRASIHMAKARYAKDYLSSDVFQAQIAAWAERETQATINKLARGTSEAPPLLLPLMAPAPPAPPAPPVVTDTMPVVIAPKPVVAPVAPAPPKAHTLDDLLAAAGLDRKSALKTLAQYGIHDSASAYSKLKMFDKLPAGIDRATFTTLYDELVASQLEPVSQNGHGPNG